MERFRLDDLTFMIVVPDQVNEAGIELVGALDVAIPGFRVPPAHEMQGEPPVEVGEIPESLSDGVEVVVNAPEYLGIRFERDGCAVFFGLCPVGALEFRDGDALGVALPERVAIAAGLRSE